MKSRFNKFILICLLILTGFSFTFSQTLGLKGLLSGWFTLGRSVTTEAQLGFRYLPEFSLEKAISKKYTFDLEFSLNAYGSAHIPSFENINSSGKIKPYRMWMRFSSSQFEARLGLQKINFGSASLLRPLMWFDRIDPRDPLRITDGVYGLLLRYYFLNNSNIWLWGLYGNEGTKGWEFIPTAEGNLEYGGRIQVPFFKGEIALTYHHRRIDLAKGMIPIFADDPIIPEERVAFDGKWDIGIGLWVEGALIRQDSPALLFKWKQSLNVGLDYTFGIGNGLHVLGEHFFLGTANNAFEKGEGFDFSALSMNYPLGLLDTLSGIFYYDWENKNFYRFINWQRTYDRWSFYVMGFWNPESFQIYQNQPESSLFAGKGFQVMVVFNH
jgi:hypothetical protein